MIYILARDESNESIATMCMVTQSSNATALVAMASYQASAGRDKSARLAAAKPLGRMADPFQGLVRL
jgi:hypothetical protein